MNIMKQQYGYSNDDEELNDTQLLVKIHSAAIVI